MHVVCLCGKNTKSDAQCQGARNPISAPTSLSKQHNMPSSWGNKAVSIAGINWAMPRVLGLARQGHS